MKMIGLFFNQRILKRMIKAKPCYEQLTFYTDLAREKKVNLFLYSFPQLKIKRSHLLASGYIYLYRKNTLKQKTIKIPKVTLSRAIIYRKKNARKLKQLSRKYKCRFLNLISNTERDKNRLYKQLVRNQTVRSYLPETRSLQENEWIELIFTYHQAVIKPSIGRLGKNMWLIEKKENMYDVANISSPTLNHQVFTRAELERFYLENFPRPSSFIIQEWIPTQRYQGRKFDIRTSVQKDKRGKWIVSGIVAKVAAPKKQITNVARGAETISYHKLGPEFQAETKDKIIALSIDVAKAVERIYPTLFDFGLDIALDQEKAPKLLEVNFRDQRYSYREADELEMWKASYRHPFEYAHTIYQSVQKNRS